MASRLMSSRSRIVAYMPNLKSVVRHFRAFSSYDERNPRYGQTETILNEGQSELPDPQLGPFSPQDGRFPLPGMVGPSIHIVSNAQQIDQPQQKESGLFTDQLPHERHTSVLQQFTAKIEEEVEAEGRLYAGIEPDSDDLLECVAQDCPQLLKKDFRDLFPERSFADSPLTVIVISQKTQNDMSGWNENVEIEREQLLEHFITSAEEICSNLQSAGYWADFIDPSSGRPYLGAYTNATLFETDERYRQFGFQINDLGCCKVISHHLWGTNTYVGSLFTNAPYDHPILQDMSIKSKAHQN